MKSLNIIITSIIIALSGMMAKAQNTGDSVKITYKNKSVTIKPEGDESTSVIKFKDTAAGKNIVVKVSYLDNDNSIEKMIENQLDSSAKKMYDLTKYKGRKKRKHFIQTEFLHTFDIGFASTINESENNFTYTPKLGKSANISIGIINQNMNIYRNQILFSYGINYNGYYLKYKDKQQIQYLDNNGLLNAYKDTLRNYDKNRLDVRYFSVPVLLEYHSKNNNFSIAAGIEFSFNGFTKYKQKGDQNSLEFKQSDERDIKINPTQLNAVLRLGIDDVAIFGKYAITDMYKSSAYTVNNNPGQHLFSFGICLFGI